MVGRVTDRAGGGGLNRRVRSEIEAILATVTGPGSEFVAGVAQDVLMAFVWSMRNTGESPGMASMRINLQVDAFFGDFSQLIVEDDLTMVGALSTVASIDLVDYPKVIEPGATATLSITLRIPSLEMEDRQGSVAGFNWWIAEVLARDFEKDQNAQGDSTFEVRDWFRLTPSPLAPAVIEVIGNPGFSANVSSALGGGPGPRA